MYLWNLRPAVTPLPCSSSDQLVIMKYPHETYAQNGALSHLHSGKKEIVLYFQSPPNFTLHVGVLSRGEGRRNKGMFTQEICQFPPFASWWGARDPPSLSDTPWLPCVTFPLEHCFVAQNLAPSIAEVPTYITTVPTLLSLFPSPTALNQTGEDTTLGIIWSCYSIG